MKTLGIIGFIPALLITLLALYVQLVATPAVEAMDALYIETGEFGSDLSFAAREGMMNMAYTVLIGSIVADLLCMIGFI